MTSMRVKISQKKEIFFKKVACNKKIPSLYINTYIKKICHKNSLINIIMTSNIVQISGEKHQNG